MPEQFIGAEVRAGSFNDDHGKMVVYNNLMLTFVKAGNVGVMANDRAPLVKVKNTREDIFRVFGEMITMKWLKDRLGWYADVFYDQKKSIARILFYGPEDPMKGDDPGAAVLTPDEGISDYTHTETAAAPLGALEEQLASSAPADTSPVEDKKGGKK